MYMLSAIVHDGMPHWIGDGETEWNEVCLFVPLCGQKGAGFDDGDGIEKGQDEVNVVIGQVRHFLSCGFDCNV